MTRSVCLIVIGLACCLPMTGCGSSSADSGKMTEEQQSAQAARNKATEDAFKDTMKAKKKEKSIRSTPGRRTS